jgi:hypothetical protein
MKLSQLKQLIKEEIQKEIKTVPNNNSALLKKMLEYNEEYGESIISSFFPYDTLEQWMEESEYDEDDNDSAEAKERFDLAKTYYSWQNAGMIMHLYVGVNEDVDIQSLPKPYKTIATYGTGYEEVYIILATF